LSSAPEPTRRGLGRGLDVLVGGRDAAQELVQIPVAAIHPNPRQPRRSFDGDESGALTESVRAQGIVQPLLVRPRPAGGYELIAGERRWRAAREAGVTALPALVRDADDRETLLLALVENVARKQLSPVEEARAYAVLLDEFGLTLGEVAERVGRSKPGVSNRVRLLELPPDLLELVQTERLSEGHARALLAVPDQDERRRLARRILHEGMSVRGAERAAQLVGARTRIRRASPVSPALAERARTAVDRLTGFRARVARDRLEITYEGEHELAELVEALERAADVAFATIDRPGD
jgi:ParB family transcriptional regulator, chromosome partitioning protein